MLIDFRTLFPKYNIKPTGALHIGGNIGEEAPVYNQLGIIHQVWYEANPEIFKKLVLNIAFNENAKAYNYCVGETEGETVMLHVSNNAGQSSSTLELKTHSIAHPDVHYIKDVPVKTIRLDQHPEHLNKYLDFLNIDIQGQELMALKGMGDLLNQFKWCYIEVNKDELYLGCARVEEIDEYLSNFGFTRVETKWCGNTGWGDALYIRK